MDAIKNFITDAVDKVTNPTKDLFKITGDVPYIVDVNITGGGPYSNSVLTVNAFTKSTNRIAIAIKCKWSRKYNNTYRSLSCNSNTYQISP